MCVFSTVRPDQAVAWTEVLERIKDCPTVSFTYTLEVAKRSEDENFNYEYDGPPLAIAEDVTISADQDVNLVSGQVDDEGHSVHVGDILPQSAPPRITS